MPVRAIGSGLAFNPSYLGNELAHLVVILDPLRSLDAAADVCRQRLGLLQGDPQEFLQAGSKLDDAAIAALIAQRAEAKAAKNFGLADQIRKDLLAQSIVLKDGPSGTTWEVAQ